MTAPSAPTYLRASTLRGLAELVAELGADPAVVWRESGIDGQLVDDAALVPVHRVATALAVARRETGTPGIALLLAARQDAGVLGPLSVCLQSAPTIGEALACTTRYLYVHAPDSALAHRLATRDAMDLVLVQAPAGLGPELGLGITHRVLHLVCGGDYGLREVRLPRVPDGGRALAEEFFGAPVRLGCPEPALRVPASLPKRAIASGNAIVHRMAVEYLETHGALAASGLAARVHDIVTNGLGTSPPLIGSVARVLGMHPRTLQRRLAEEGTTYAAIVDSARRETAWRLVTTTDLPFARVATLAGMADASVLTRSCRRWFGDTPTTVRREAWAGHRV